jgi:hypothetical protein
MATVVTRSPNKPKYRRAVDKTKYDAMKKALLKFFPKKAPGKTQTQMVKKAKTVNKRLFPGTTAQWWAKCVQLDLEARSVLVREKTKPLRWHRR